MANASILQASVLGTIAFNSGKKSIPVLDKDFMRFLLETPGINTLSAIDAWAAAWHAANLSKAFPTPN